MVHNDNFNKHLKESGISMYALAKRSGIPYTTINELHNGKNSINQCAVTTVYRIGAALGVKPDSLLNPIKYIDGVRGKYKSIDFIWTTSDESCITFEYDGDRVTLGTGAVYNIPARLEYYNIIAGWMIKDYIAKREWEIEAKELLERRQNV